MIPSEVVAVLEHLTPSDVDAPKVRVGREGDGGYVMLDLPAQDQTVFSYGIEREASFDLALAESGRRVFMFDHTIDEPPCTHPNMTFLKEGLLGDGPERDGMFSIEAHRRRLAPEASGSILKIDVEGDEWGALDAASPETLGAFSQIVLEAHWLGRMLRPAFLARAGRVLGKLASLFHLHHVHANNGGNLHNVVGVLVPDVLELSYVRKPLVRASPSGTVFPTALDFANYPPRADHLLWFYPFLPAVDPGPQAYRTCVERVEQRYLAVRRAAAGAAST